MKMALQYFSKLPEELRQKIYLDHLKELRKKEFLEKAIEAQTEKYTQYTLKEDLSEDEVIHFERFLQSLTRHYGDIYNKRCLIKWKSEISSQVKYKVMEEQHWQLYGYSDMDNLLCGELLFPEDAEDVTYEDGAIVNSKELDTLFKELGIQVVYIEIGRGVIITPNCINIEVV
uniref:Cell cycle link protein n=1 Tax=Sophora yellow stunt virus TaxID=1980160 RepID=A0A1W5YSG9_9VIRU|nr:cell cycle link protein [Sophora yellow stunt virus]WGT79596.1 cell cycle link protein [Sophora yellow stunt virus]